MNKMTYLKPFGWKKRTRAGGVILGWTDYEAIAAKRRRGLWDGLVRPDLVCPSCGHQWQPKTETKIPISCPACKSYSLSRWKEPWPVGYELVPNSEWSRMRWFKPDLPEEEIDELEIIEDEEILGEDIEEYEDEEIFEDEEAVESVPQPVPAPRPRVVNPQIAVERSRIEARPPPRLFWKV